MKFPIMRLPLPRKWAIATRLFFSAAVLSSAILVTAGIALSTLKLFEYTGQISLDRLLRIAAAMGRLEEFLSPFAPPPARSLDEIEALSASPLRKHGGHRSRRALGTS